MQSLIGKWTTFLCPRTRRADQHQTKCDEFVRKPNAAANSHLLQPDVDYSAPEIVQSAKCSHKSDLFSYGLLFGQVYDLCEHRAPISCKTDARNYELELKKVSRAAVFVAAKTKCVFRLVYLCTQLEPCHANLLLLANLSPPKQLQERRKLRLAKMVPFETRAALLAMLDAEPNARPSANYVLQVSKARAI